MNFLFSNPELVGGIFALLGLLCLGIMSGSKREDKIIINKKRRASVS